VSGIDAKLVKKVAKAIDDVKLFSRFNDWTSDRVEGFPIEIFRHSRGDIVDPVVVKRFAGTEKELDMRLQEVLREARAIAAIKAMTKFSKSKSSSSTVG
jgi:hypothetical protein